MRLYSLAAAALLAAALLAGTAVAAENAPPLADAGLDQTVPTNTTVYLDADGSRDPDGTVVRVSWTVETPSGATLSPNCRTCRQTHFRPTVAGQYNVTVSVTDDDGGDPVVRLLAPNGTVLYTNDDGGIGDTAELTMVALPETGKYTIIATSNEPNTAFTYYLTVDQFIPPAQRDVMFAGNPSTWNHTEQLGEFAYDYRVTFEDGDTPKTDIEYAYVNGEENYVVVIYEMSPNASQDTRTRIDTALMLAHSNLDKAYRHEPDPIYNESWTPDRVYHRAVTPDGELYRVTYTTTEWARQYEEDNIELRTYLFRYFTTLTHGPAHQSYVEGANNSTATGEIEGRDKSGEIEVGVR